MSSKYVRNDRIFAVAEVGHGDAGQPDVPSGCFQRAVLAEHERPGVIGFDEPFGVRLVAHFEETGVLQGRRRRAVDSTILADAVAAQGTVTQLLSATEWALTAGVPGWRRRSGGTRCRDGMSPLRASMR